MKTWVEIEEIFSEYLDRPESAGQAESMLALVESLRQQPALAMAYRSTAIAAGTDMHHLLIWPPHAQHIVHVLCEEPGTFIIYLDRDITNPADANHHFRAVEVAEAVAAIRSGLQRATELS
jgi:hypothetical protein